MKNTRTPTLMAILALSILLLLPGYKKLSDDAYPAPIEKPAVAFYANFAASGLYDQSNTAAEAFNEIISSVEAICQARGRSNATNAVSRAAIEAILNDKVLSGALKAHEIYFYFRDPENFAFILSGEFSAGKIADLIGKDRINATSGGLNSVLKSPVAGMNRLHLELKGDQLLICPENIAGNIIDNLSSRLNLLGSEFSSFDKMVRNRPAMAAEVNFDSLHKTTEKKVLPAWLYAMKHLRLIAASRITKMQMFVPDNSQRVSLMAAMNKHLNAINSVIGDKAALTIANKGNSIFIEAPAQTNLEKTISRRTASFVLHFFARNSRSDRVLTASGNE